MKNVLVGGFLVGMNLLMPGCNPQRPAGTAETVSVQRNEVIETIRSRRSIRQYQDRTVNRDAMQLILDCGILAPNGMNKQSWEVRVVDNPDFIKGITDVYKKANPGVEKDLKFNNLFRSAPTVAFITHDPGYDCSQIDCGLLGENKSR